MSGPSPKVKILLVDDQSANLLALESMLEHASLELVKASSGSEALRHLLRDDFAVVLLDVQMPILDGFETAELIRQRERSSYTPIIFITAINTNETQVSRGYSLGAVDYIFKPIVPEVLKAKVQVFVELFKKTNEVKRQFDVITAVERQLRESEERYRGIFTAVSEPILLFEPVRKRIVDANEAALRLYGYSRQEIGKMRLEELAAKKTPREGPRLMHRKKDGSTFPAEASEVRFSAGRRDLGMLIVRDITDRLKAAEAERVSAQDRMQREFVATVSHELRTPIAAIKGFAETLRNGGLKDTANRMQFVRTIERHADRLGFLVEDLLTLAALESGKITPQPKRFGLEHFVRDYVESISPLARNKDVTIEIEIPKDIEVQADQRHFAQVIQNLIDNAIKYNRPGGKVLISAEPNCRMATISIKDTGIGIHPNDLPLMFTRFHRSDSARAMEIRGTGLGLYIIKVLIETNGGKIWVESVKGKGSTFSFTVPIRQGVAAAA